jgi:hypothetical protein
MLREVRLWRVVPEAIVADHHEGRDVSRRGWIVLVVLLGLLVSCGPGGIEEPSPLVRAVTDQDLARVERLLNEGADPNQRTLTFPLQAAAARENIEILELLLARGAVVQKAVDKDTGWSPLFAAAQDGPSDAVRLLLAAGADPCARTSASWAKGLRPSQVARTRGNERAAPTLDEAERARCSS